MDELKEVQNLIDMMEAVGMDYLLVGSLASSHYGLDRMTRDADFLIEADAGKIEELKRRLPVYWKWEPQTAFDPVTGKTRHLLILGDTTFKVELFELEEDAFDFSRMKRRLIRTADGRKRFVQSPEDVVVQKLRWFKPLRRRKDWDDVQQVILAQRDRLDWQYIREWCDRLEISDTLEQVLASLPADPV